MNIESIEIREIRIPFRFRYGHAKACHRGVESVLCIVRDGCGFEGYGEAVPRAYVTGESTASIRHRLPVLVRSLLERTTTFDAFRTGIGRIEQDPSGPVAGCALCALDLAVTDLAARQCDKSVARLLCSRPADELTYTASIGIGSGFKLTPLLLLYKAMGIRSFKVKVGDDGDLDRVRLIHRILGSDIRLFADANGAWDREPAARRIDELAARGVWAIEEPLRVTGEASRHADGRLDRETLLTDAHFQNNAWLQERSAIPLIADESLISLSCARRIVEHQAFRIFNIRLSKCGGYLRGSQFAATARAAGLSFSLGAMVGESPVLATAGAAWAASEPEHIYLQGHSHRLLHGASFADGCPRLGRGGHLKLPHHQGSGLTLNRDKLAPLTLHRNTIEL